MSQTGHPASLRIFFATEMWERYGFYVVQTLLALYLTRHFHWSDSNIYTLVGSFTALTYVSPVVGGWIADRLLGQKRAIIAGGVILLLSYLVLGWVTSETILLLTLAGIAVGTGLFKPNISSLLGNEYSEDAVQRENGFTVFYMGITTGIILGCTLPSQLVYHFGWSVAFISAGIGMILGLAVFAVGIYRYNINDYTPYQYQFKKIAQAILLILSLWLACFYILHNTTLANVVFLAIVALLVFYFIYSIKRDTPYEAKKTLVIAILCIISAIFWSFYFQMFLSFTLFISRAVDQTLFGIPFPAPYYVSIQSFGAIVIGFFLARRNSSAIIAQPGIQSGNKFQLAMLFITLSFVFITAVSNFSGNIELISPLLILPVYFMISLAELFLYPVGLSAITVLASQKKVSTMMGVFFVSLGVGGFLAGKLASLAAISSPEETSLLILKAHYSSAFIKISCLLIVSFLICVLLNRMIKQVLKSDT